MLTASLFFALSGVAVHGLGTGGWDIALLSRALFGLPFALFIFFTGPRAECRWNNFSILLRSTSAVIFLAMLYFILEFYSPGESFTLASMRPLWVAGLSMVLGICSVRLIFWPLSAAGVVGIALMEGSLRCSCLSWKKCLCYRRWSSLFQIWLAPARNFKPLQFFP